MKHRLSWFLLLSGALLSAPLSFGAGHPILLVGNSSNPFSYYYSEILHAEGLNTFDSADLSSVTATTLSSYDVVILGEGPLTSAQATMFTIWVNGGGNLIAMRPDKQLASLLGLTSTGGTLANEYLLVNTGTAPGAGIVGQTIQFHGTADLYTLSGASAVATLYSSATASTAYPAVSLRLGAGAGNAAAFTFDLARSVVYTRQGNPAWAGEARIGQGGPIRSTDLYYGAATFDPEPDWVDRNNIAIPQADEQQRLLVNLILYLNQTRKPLPRFWYLPFGKKAAVVMTGDDHGNNGTAGRFNDYLANSPAGCSVANWECVRATTYMYPNTPLPNAQAATFAAQGFELAVHLTTDCADFTPTSLEATYVSQLSAFQTAFPSLAAPITNRTHCIAWSDWGTQFQVERNHGIRFDTNYYFWPPSWVTSTPGFFTGSGIPMRFAQTDGTIVDIYQAPTQMTDESGQSYPSTVTGLLNNAVGSAGFYGVFTANMHNDFNNCGTSCPDGETSEVSAEQIVAAAQSAGVPVVSAQQMLQWLDGRNGSSFDSVSWTGSALQFTITAASGANGLQAMLPAAFAAGGLSAITLAGSPVTYSLSTIKGIQYAVFTAAAGTYQATYATVLPPSISAVTATPGSSTATITWTTDKSSTSRVDYGISAGALTSTQSNSALVTSHSITLTGLTSPTVYYFRVTSVDAGGNSSTSPATSGSPATFTTITPTPPVISAILATPALNGTAVISWTTDKASNSRVDYGTSTALGSTVSDAGMVTAHGITLSGLTIGTTYYFRVTSADPLGDTASAPTSPSSFVENGGISVWSASTTPGTIDAGDTNSVELGMKFRSDVAGIVTGVRFYKAPTNTGTHIGNLWSSTGTLLATVTFTNETSYGWQQANFATPVSIAANTTYVVSYFAPAGHYSASSGFFTSAGANNAPLHALQSGVDGSNGLYRYVTASAFPNSSWSDTNYWVDLAFTDNVPPVISSLTAATTTQTATITWTTSEPATSRLDYGTTTSLGTTVTDGTMLTAHSFTLSGLTTGTKYYYRVTSVDGFGNSTTSPVTTNSPATFTPADTTPPVITAVAAAAGSTTATITWTTDENSTSRVDYGTSSTSLNKNTSSATLTTAHSILLSGLTTNTTYYYRVTSVDASGNSATSPVTTSSAATFITIDTTPPVISAVTVVPNSGDTAAINWTTNKLSSSRVDYGATKSLGSTLSNATLVTAHSITLTGLTTGAIYYYRVTSSDSLGDTSSSPVAPSTASFVDTAGTSLWNSSTLPDTVDAGDASAVELGMKFRSDVAGTVSAIRFYKAAANTGTHTGHLWSKAGTLLGTVTFSGETASGWQQANFTTPISIAANTTYVVSYYAPAGHYSDTSGFFASAADNAPLHGLANGTDGSNGVYQYGSGGTFPSSSWNSSNYWVDLVFFPSDLVPPTVTAFTIPASASSLTVAVTTFTATDNTAVTGYLLTETATTPSAGATGWSTTAPTSYTFTMAGTRTLYAWAKDGAGNVSAPLSATVTIPLSLTNPEPTGWYAGDMHVHRSCGSSPEAVSTMFGYMNTNNLAVMSLLADMGNGEVQNATTDLPLVNGQDASVSTAGRILHWDTEWHWDTTYTQYAHQALGGHIVALGLTSAQQIWQEYTYPILSWAHQQGALAGFAHLQYFDGSIPETLTCCSPMEYPVEVALGAADFISEDVDDTGAGFSMYPDAFLDAYYKLLNSGFRPGFAAGTDYPCNSSRPAGSLLTYVQQAGGQLTYQGWIQGIAKGRTVVSRNAHHEFLALTVNGTSTPGDEIDLTTAGTVTASVQWTAAQSLSGTIQIVSNGAVVASTTGSVAPGSPMTWSTTVSFPKSGWLAARRMGTDGHLIHTAAVFVIVNGAPIRASASDAQYFVNWIDNLLTNTSSGGPWNYLFPTSLAAAQARYQAAKAVFQQRQTDAAGTSVSIFTNQVPAASGNEAAYELGTRFYADAAGQITQVRLYTTVQEGGNHTVRIWRVSDSALLAGPYTWTITSGVAGWKSFTLPTALTIAANTDYIVDISNSSDYNYVSTSHGFDSAIVNGHLHTYTGSGLFSTTLGTIPAVSWNNSNYFRDIVFVPF